MKWQIDTETSEKVLKLTWIVIMGLVCPLLVPLADDMFDYTETEDAETAD